jgi:hypothetical protein
VGGRRRASLEEVGDERLEVLAADGGNVAGMPRSARNAASSPTAEVYVAIVAGETRRAARERRQEATSGPIAPGPVVSCAGATG